MAGDFNAHNTMWNCDKTDFSGDLLQEDIDCEDMYIINKDTKSRLGNSGQRDTNIDLMFATEEILEETKYEQMSDTWGSDHFPIMFEISMRKEIYKKKTNRLSTKKTNWNEYSSVLSKEVNKLEEREYKEMLTKEEKYVYIVNRIKEAVCEATYGREKAERRKKKVGTTVQRKKLTKQRNNPVSWWDKECQEAIDKRKGKFLEFKRTKK